MKVSRQFLRDFAYLANLYGWTVADIEDVKAQTRANPEQMRRYWTALAAAHRAGYEQTASNGYIRLHEWCARHRQQAPGFSRPGGPPNVSATEGGSVTGYTSRLHRQVTLVRAPYTLAAYLPGAGSRYDDGG